MLHSYRFLTIGITCAAVPFAAVMWNRLQTDNSLLELEKMGDVSRAPLMHITFPVLSRFQQHVPTYVHSAKFFRYSDEDCDIDAFFKTVNRCRRLEQLEIHDWELEDQQLAGVGSFPRLRKLIISGSQQFNGVGLRYFPPNPSLRSIDLSHTVFSDDGGAELLKFQNLEEVNLDATEISDAGLRLLAKLPHLKYLWVSSLYITNSGLQSLLASPSLEYVDCYPYGRELIEDAVDEAGINKLEEQLAERRSRRPDGKQ